MQTTPNLAMVIPSGDSDPFDEMAFVNALLKVDTAWGPGGPGTAKVLYDSGHIAAAQAAFDVVGIDQAWTHLRFLALLRCDQVTGANANAWLRFNGDTAANYFPPGSNAVAQLLLAAANNLAGTSTPANAFTYADFRVPLYTNTVALKAVHGFSNRPWHADGVNGGQVDVGTVGGQWNSTAAINRVTISLPAGLYVAGSRLVIVGEK